MFLNKITNPNPALQINPAIHDPNVMQFVKYKSDKITELAQLGISPTNTATSGVKYELSSRNKRIFSSLTKVSINRHDFYQYSIEKVNFI